ncbi:MAG: nucleotidyltransferase family protein [Bacteroidales bacterium]|nr:nucleotidyltransferase family protein [Bacteroidales bacterium]
MQGLFSELIRVSIEQQENLSQVPTEREWVELFNSAVKQAVAGVCFYGVQRLPKEQKTCLPVSLRMEWLAMAAQIQARNELINRRCLELQQMLAENGLKGCVLKGRGVADLYKVDYNSNLGIYRQCGDIDVWVDASREELVDYVMKVAPTREFDQKHIHYHVFDDVDVEMHWIPVNRNSPRFNRILGAYFRKESSRQFSNRSGEVCYPTIDFQLVHQLLHVYSHYVYEGVGLRQLMDLYFTQRRFMICMPEKVGEILSLFNRIGLMKFVAGTQYVVHLVFCMGKETLLCAPDAKEGQLLLKEIEIGGNFGQFDKRNNVNNESFVHKFWRRYERRWRMVRFDPWGTILMPFSRIGLETWMRTVRRKYEG